MVRLLFLLLLIFSSRFVNGFEWERITTKDWDFKIPDSVSIRHSAILFEKIFADDSRMFDKECIYSIYKRIRVYQEEGRKYADVQVPIMGSDCELNEIKGHVILKDNTVIELTDDHIFEKYVLESEGNEIEQTFFYLPGVTSDCIIEYYIEYEMSSSYPYWFFEKEIFLKYTELVWKFYSGRGMTNQLYNIVKKSLVPNYVLVNKIDKVKIDKIKDDDNEVVEILFNASNIKPFKEEDNIISPKALKSQVICFYQNSKESEIFWIGQSRRMKEEFRDERNENKKIAELKKIVPDSLKTKGKIEFVYNWILENITNTSNYNGDKKFEDNPCVDSLINRRYGPPNEINNLFCQVLNALEIEAYPIYCLSRNENIFRPSAKYWQFDNQFTAIKKTNTSFDYYDLSDKNIPIGFLDYQFEGTIAYIVGCLPLTDFYIPSSNYTSNVQMFYDNIDVLEDLRMKSSFKSKYTGYFAKDINEQLDEINSSGKSLNSLLESNIFIKSVDTIKISTKNSMTVSMEGNLEFEDCFYPAGDFLIFNPFSFVEVSEELEPTSKREQQLQFDYSYNQKRVMQINLPSNLRVFKTPEDFIFKNDIGECLASTTPINERLLSVSYSFTLKQSIIETKQYQDLIKLIEARKTVLSKMVLFSRTN